MEEGKVDVIVLGTDVSQTVLAGALAHTGRRVLHIDANPYYGGARASFDLAAMVGWLRSAEHVARAGAVTREASACAAATTAGNLAADGDFDLHEYWAKVAMGSRVEPPDAVKLGQWTKLVGDAENHTTTAGAAEIPVDLSFRTLHGAEFKLGDDSTVVTTGSRAPPSARTCWFGASVLEPLAPVSPPPVPGGDGCTAAAVKPVPAAAMTRISALLATPRLARRFVLDLVPALLYSRGPVVDVLVASDVAKYIEFKAVDDVYCATASSSSSSSSLWRVPASRADIFRSQLPLSDKRALMQFMHVVGDSGGADANTHGTGQRAATADAASYAAAAAAQLSERRRRQRFSCFIAEQRLPPQLAAFALYAIALLPRRQPAITDGDTAGGAGDDAGASTHTGLQALRRFVGSMGRYGPGAFLHPVYGVSELPQAFARLCAVNGGIYMLRAAPAALVFAGGAGPGQNAVGGKRRFVGLITDTLTPQFLAAPHLIASVDYLPTAVVTPPPSQRRGLARCICVTDGRVQLTVGRTSTALSGAAPGGRQRAVRPRPGAARVASVAEAVPAVVGADAAPSTPRTEATCLFVLPPAAENVHAHPIRVLQLSSDMQVAPAGFFVVHLWTQLDDTGDCDPAAQRERVRAALEPTVRALFCVSGSNATGSTLRPNLVWAGFWGQRCRESDTLASKLLCDNDGDSLHVMRDPDLDGVSLAQDIDEARTVFARVAGAGVTWFATSAGANTASEIGPGGVEEVQCGNVDRHHDDLEALSDDERGT